MRVEVHIGSGLPAFALVGLPETVVRESRERVRSALLTSGFEFPAGRITVNLAPADLPKEGGRFDLPIALGILAASGQLPARALTDREFYGELALSGELRETPKLLPSLVEGRAHRTRVGPPQRQCRRGELGRRPPNQARRPSARGLRRAAWRRSLGGGRNPGWITPGGAARPRGSARAVHRETRARDRGGGRSRHAHDWSARGGKDAARPAVAGTSAAAREPGGLGGREPRIGRRQTTEPRLSAAVSKSPAYGLGRGLDRRRLARRCIDQAR